MPSTGFLNPSTLFLSNGPFTGGGSPQIGAGWGSILSGTIFASDDGYYGASTAGPSGPTLYTGFIGASNYGVSLPSGSTIDGVEVRIEAADSGGVGSPGIINFVALLDNGSLLGTAKNPGTSVTTTDAFYTFGNSGDTWSASLTESKVEETTFGAFMQMSSTGSNNHRVDVIQINVHYTENAASNLFVTSFGFF